MLEPKERWQKEDSGGKYAGARWRSMRRRGNDPRLVRGILARHLPPRTPAAVLDVPCGTARLRPAIEGGGCTWFGLDVSASMLTSAAAEGRPLLRGDVEALPFPDDAFDAVVCCRLLHHLADPAVFARTVGELVRVSRHLVVASFWDAGSLPARHRARFPKRGRRVGRVPHAKSHVREVFARHGAQVLGFRHTLRFFSRQTFVVARKHTEVTRG